MPGQCAFRQGPLKIAARCRAKVANDYSDERFPQSAKLLDLVRCAYVVADVEGMLKVVSVLQEQCATPTGKREVPGIPGSSPGYSEVFHRLRVGRLKNMFIGDKRGYRDWKMNLVFETQAGQRMLCEVQVILRDMLLFKKRETGLYSITRDAAFFRAVVEAASGLGLKLDEGAVLEPE